MTKDRILEIIKNRPPVIEQILKARGITGEENIQEFFSPAPKLTHDPFLLAGMSEGVDLLLKAVDENKKIFVYGDYDADGVTATAVMMKAIRCYTDNVDYYIPSRMEEGYGLNIDAIDKIVALGGQVILTVDCGAASRVETEYAHKLGIETIVTDHHIVGEDRAEGIIVDPKLSECKYPFKGLAGAGVAYKFVLALNKKRELPRSLITELVEIVTIGTVADMMPLLDENRTIVKFGLRLIHGGVANLGLRCLINEAGLDYKKITSSDISFGIAPRINAVGRMGDASVAVKLLLTEDPGEAALLAAKLNETNALRKSVQGDTLDVCMEMAESQLEDTDFIVLEVENAHEGILGIVAGNIKEKLQRPVVIISHSDDLCKGTGRSTEKIDLYSMLAKYKDIFIRFGGHSKACGFSIKKEDVDILRQGLSDDIAAMKAEDETIFEKERKFDALITPGEVTTELAEMLELFEPCGTGNETPKLLFENVSISDWRYLKHGTEMARFRISGKVDAVTFSDAKRYKFLSDAGTVNLIGSVNINEWNGYRKPQVIVDEIYV